MTAGKVDHLFSFWSYMDREHLKDIAVGVSYDHPKENHKEIFARTCAKYANILSSLDDAEDSLARFVNDTLPVINNYGNSGEIRNSVYNEVKRAIERIS